MGRASARIGDAVSDEAPERDGAEEAPKRDPVPQIVLAIVLLVVGWCAYKGCSAEWREHDKRAEAARAKSLVAARKAAETFAGTLIALGAEERLVRVVGIHDASGRLQVMWGRDLRVLSKERRLDMARDLVSAWTRVRGSGWEPVDIVDNRGNVIGGSRRDGDAWVE